jgi:hypothetical protein
MQSPQAGGKLCSWAVHCRAVKSKRDTCLSVEIAQLVKELVNELLQSLPPVVGDPALPMSLRLHAACRTALITVSYLAAVR